MRWYNSIITKITLIFSLALIGIVAIILTYMNHERNKEINNMQNLAKYAMRSAYDRTTKTLDFNILKEYGFEQVRDEKLKKELLDEHNNIVNNHNNMRMRKNYGMKLGIKSIAHEGKIYIFLKAKTFENIVLKAPFEKEFFPAILFPIISILLVILLYIAIIRSITPLYDLRKKVKSFADGNLDIECASKNKDEIATLANEFDNAVKKIKRLRDSRQLFLRNIMHELKTPIMKGKFVAELSEDEKQQKSLQNIFRRQESLIEEFSRIEKLSADELKLNIQTYNIEDVLDFSLDILNQEDANIEKSLMPIKLHVDFELFATALKNLLDNALLYSSDKRVKIFNDERSITIVNKGEALEFELEKYAQPYFLEGKKQKSSRGLGFGLFITWHIIRLHEMQLSYKRENSENVFTINL